MSCALLPLYSISAASDPSANVTTSSFPSERTTDLVLPQRIDRLVDTAPGFVWITDTEGRVTFLNQRWYEFTGRAAPGDLGMNWLEAIHPDDREATRKRFLESIEHRGDYFVEYRLRRDDGVYLWVRAAGGPHQDSNGEYNGHIGWCMDIDTIKRSEVEIAELQERFALAIEGSADAIFDWNHIGTAEETIWFAPLLAEILEYDPGEIPLDQPAIAQRLHPEDKNVRKLALENGFADDRYDAEYRIQTKHGHYKWLRSKGIVIRDEAGSPRRMCGSIRDIDDRKRDELAIKSLHEKFENAIAGAHAGLWDWDIARSEAWLSASCKDLFGYGPSDDFPATIDYIARHIHPEDQSQVHEALRQHLKNNRVYDCEYRMRTQGGEYQWFRARGSATRDETGRAFRMSGSVVDIHPRKIAEIELRREKEKAEVTLASIGDAVVTTDAAGMIDFINAAAGRLLGKDTPAMEGRQIAEVLTLRHEEQETRLEDPIQTCLRDKRTVRSDVDVVLVGSEGAEYSIEYTASPIRRDSDHLLGAVLVLKDVTRERHLAREISFHATHDALTELVNRRAFEDRLERVLHNAQQSGGRHALCFLDLDQFKVVNDTCGHVAGDALLREIAIILKRHTRQRDTIARLGGDEFGLLMEHCNIEHANRVAETVREALSGHRFNWEGRNYQIGVSIGVTAIDADSDSVNTVLRQADTACYAAKDAGRNRVHVYVRSDRSMLQRHDEMEWVARINEGLEQNHFRLYFQRVRALDGSDAEYVELLLRYVDREMCLAPKHFLPAAARYGLATRLDAWVVEHFADWFTARKAELSSVAWFAINLSGLSLGDASFKARLLEMLASGRLPGDRLCFEITETEAIENLVTATTFFQSLKSYGCRIALDDFGSGMSSFAYLRELPVDFIKIDGSFVRDCDSDDIAHAMVKSINEIGQVMGKKTIAEWAESNGVVERLKHLGADYVQGFAVHRPAPLEEFGPD